MSNNKQETAVDWLLNEWPILNSELPQWLIEQAKEMEKEQMFEFAYEYCEAVIGGCTLSPYHYYNETYGGNK